MRDEYPMDKLEDATRWWRNADGTVVHTASCRHARVPWRYAQDFTDARLVIAVDTMAWMRFCKRCCPELEERRAEREKIRIAKIEEERRGRS